MRAVQANKATDQGRHPKGMATMSNDTDPTVTHDTYRFHLNKHEMRVRFENESEDSVDVVIEPKETCDDAA